jgi:hypothetical protein
LTAVAEELKGVEMEYERVSDRYLEILELQEELEGEK